MNNNDERQRITNMLIYYINLYIHLIGMDKINSYDDYDIMMIMVI